MAVDDAKRAGYHVIAVPASLAQSAFPGMTDLSGKQVVGLGQFIKEYNNSFEFKFVDPNDMSTSERNLRPNRGDSEPRRRNAQSG